MAAISSTPTTAETEPRAKEKDNRKQMIITKDLQQHIGDILANDIELDKEARQYFKCLCKPHTLERPEDITKLTDFLNKSQHNDAINRKTTPATVLTWVNQLREAGIKENERIINDQDAGRSSAPENDHPYLKIWADLMQRFQELTEEVVKTTRYNRVPDHLVGKVQLLKCNSAFLPDSSSVGIGAAKTDQAEAIQNVQKRKQDALEEQLEAGDDSGKTRVHLEPNRKRVGNGAGDSTREKLNDALVGMVMAQQQISVATAAKYALEEKNADQAQLEKYMEYLMNPHIPAELKVNYQRMATTLQAKIFARTAEAIFEMSRFISR